MRWNIYILLPILLSMGQFCFYGYAMVYRTDYFDEVCRCVSAEILSCETAVLDLSQKDPAGHLVLTRRPSFNNHFYCQLTVKGPADKQVQVVINDIDIPTSEGCEDNVLRVFDGMPGVSGWVLGAQCGNHPTKRLYRSKTNVMTLYYYQAHDIRGYNKHINLTYTFFHTVKLDDKLTPCNSSNDFLCENQMCISRELICDQYNNCQDDDSSDESTSWDVCGRYAKTDPVVGLAVGGVVGGLGLLTLFAAIICAIRRQKKPRLPPEDSSCAQADIPINTELNDTANIETREHQTVVSVASPDGATDLSQRNHQAPELDDALPPYTEIDQNAPTRVNDIRGSLPPSYSDLFPDAV